MLHFPYWKLVPLKRGHDSFVFWEGVCFFNESFMKLPPMSSNTKWCHLGGNRQQGPFSSGLDLNQVLNHQTGLVKLGGVSNFQRKGHIPQEISNGDFFPTERTSKKPEYLTALASNLPRDSLVRSICDGNIYLIPSFIKKSLYLRSDILENIRPDIYQYWKVDRSWFFFRPRGTWWFTGELGRYLSPTLFPIQFQEKSKFHPQYRPYPPPKKRNAGNSIRPSQKTAGNKKNESPKTSHCQAPAPSSPRIFRQKNLGFERRQGVFHSRNRTNWYQKLTCLKFKWSYLFQNHHFGYPCEIWGV